MPGSVKSIIVGGGIRAGTPSTVGTVPQFDGSAPPDLLTDSIMRQVAGPALVVSTVDPAPGALEQFRTEGGLISDAPGRADSTIIGRGAVSGGDLQVIIGFNANVGAAFPSGASVAIGNVARAGGGGVAIGSNAVAGAASGSDAAIAIGASAVAGQSGIAIGGFATGTTSLGIFTGIFGATGVNSVAIGAGSNARGTDSIGIGGGSTGVGDDRSIAIGKFAFAGGDDNVVIGWAGNNAAAAVNQCILLGSGAIPISSNLCMIGGFDANNPTTFTAIGTVLIGRGDTHTAAHDVTMRFTNASGTNIAGGNTTIVAPLGTGNASTGGELRLQAGIFGASGTTLQTAVTRIALNSAGEIVLSPITSGLRINNQMDAAGGDEGTLTNAPHALDPDFWMPVNIAGTIMAFPCWIV